MIETRCLNCGTILTTTEGTRYESAYFDNALPSKQPEASVTWARCDACSSLAHRLLLKGKQT